MYDEAEGGGRFSSKTVQNCRVRCTTTGDFTYRSHAKALLRLLPKECGVQKQIHEKWDTGLRR